MGYYGGLTVTGYDRFENLGTTASSIGDINGDGIADFVVGTDNLTTNAGSGAGAYVIFGSDTGLPQNIDVSDIDGTNGFRVQIDTGGFYGNTNYDDVQLANLGDVNGDGVNDLGLIGTRNNGYFGSQTQDTAFVLFGDSDGFERDVTVDLYMDGSSGFSIRSDEGTTIVGIQGAGDLDGDGIDDILINQQPTGYYGGFAVASFSLAADTGPVTTQSDPLPSAVPQIPVTVAYAIFGDENLGNTGRVDTADIDGTNGFGIEGRESTFEGGFGEGGYGYNRTAGGVIALGDINGDGFADLGLHRVAALTEYTPYSYDPETQEGIPPSYAVTIDSQAFVLFGDDNSAPTALKTGEANGQQVFWDELSRYSYYQGEYFFERPYGYLNNYVQVAALGDINGDGFDDVGISITNRVLLGERNPYAEDGDDAFGVMGIIFGGPDGIDRDGDGPQDGLNANVSLASSTTDPDTGETMLINEPDILVVNSIGSANGGSRFASTFAAAGDINGDGIGDFIVSHPSAPGGINGESSGYGATYLILGRDETAGEMLPSILDLDNLSQPEIDQTFYKFVQNEERNTGFGYTVGAAGDINGDGIDDLLLTARNFDIENPNAEGSTYDDVGRAIVVFGGTDALEASDNADGSNDNAIDVANLGVDVLTGALPIEVSINNRSFFSFVAEGDAGATTLSFQAQRTGDLTAEVSVDFTVSGTGFAPATGDDFVGGSLPSGTVTFAQGSAVAEIAIEINGDLVIENNETFEVTLSDPVTDSGVDISLGQAVAQGRINNDDQPVRFSVSNASANEDGDVVFTIFRFGETQVPASVDFSLSGFGFNSATTADIDRVLVDGAVRTALFGTEIQVDFAEGQTSEQVVVELNDDMEIEGTETFAINLLNAQGGVEAVISDNRGIGTIFDNDFGPEILVRVAGSTSVFEGNSGFTPVTFEIVRRGDTSGVTEVTYDLNPIPFPGDFFAADGNDIDSFLPSFGNTVRFEDGESIKEVTVNIIGDGIIEPRERFELRLTEIETTNGADYDIVAANSVITIINDDGRPANIPNGVEADVFGDPHIVTLDGLGYDFQAVGEYVLVESTIENDPRDFSVQVRFEPLPGSDLVSVTTRMAVNVGTDIIEIDALGADPLLINGVPATAEQLQRLFIDLDGDDLEDITFNEDLTEFTIFLNDLNENLKIKNMDGVLNICVFLSNEDGGHGGNVQGLMGNANGDNTDDLQLRDGSVPFTNPTFEELYVTYANSWALTSGERNFSDPEDSGVFPEGFPAAKIGIEDLPDTVRDSAEAAVAAAGIEEFEEDGTTPNPLYEAAVLDFALTGDDDFIQGVLGLAADPDAEVDVSDAPEIPVSIGVTPQDTRVNEADGNPNTVFFTFYRIGDTAEAITIDYAIGGDVDAADLVAGTDLTGQVTIPAGASETVLAIGVVNDDMTELDEALTVSITGSDMEDALIAGASGTTIIETDDFAPDAEDDTFSIDADEGIDGNLLLANPDFADADPNGDPITIVGGVDANGSAIPLGSTHLLPSGATLDLEADGSFFYDPTGEGFGDRPSDLIALADGEIATDSFTYTISDGKGGFDEATVTFNVTGVNDAPDAADDDFSTDEDTFVSQNLLTDNGSGADNDIDGDDISVLSVTDSEGVTIQLSGGATFRVLPSGATLQVDSEGNFLYDPMGVLGLGPRDVPTAFNALKPGEFATDTFSYTIVDENGLEDTAEVTINIEGVNDGPDAVDDAFSVDEDVATVIDFLGNDSDPEGDDLTVTITSGPVNGTLEQNSDGAWVYTSALNFNGVDGFTYEISDGDLTDTATVDLAINAVNDDPVGVDDDVSVMSGQTVFISFADLLSNDTDVDGDALSITGNSAPTDSSFVPTDAPGFVYDPGDFIGTASFTYDISDGNGGTSSATVTIEVDAAPNEDVEAVDDRFTISEDADETELGNLLANDEDPDGDAVVTGLFIGDQALDLDSVNPLIEGGAIFVGSDGTVLFDPNGDFEEKGFNPQPEPPADITLTYTISDGEFTSEGTLEIVVEGQNDAPEFDAFVFNFDVDENTTDVGNVSATDVDGDVVVYALRGEDADLFNIDETSGDITFIDAPDFESGVTEFNLTVEASDGVDSDTAQVVINVQDVDEGPVLNDVIGTNGIDRLVGTDAADRIDLLGGRLDFATGGGGADVFDFASSSTNGVRERKIITDFEVGVDMLDFGDAEVTSVRSLGPRTFITLDEDGDQILLLGVSSLGTDFLI